MESMSGVTLIPRAYILPTFADSPDLKAPTPGISPWSQRRQGKLGGAQGNDGIKSDPLSTITSATGKRPQPAQSLPSTGLPPILDSGPAHI